MRTKTLLLTAALGIAGIASTTAQVYSVNAVGYVNTSLPTGFSMVANPLNGSSGGTLNNTLTNILQGVANFTQVFKWNGTGYDVSTFFNGVWAPNVSFNPGEGFFINVAAPTTVTFVGDVPQGTLVNPIPAGYSIKASMVPQAGGVDTLGLTGLSNFDQLFKWNGTGFDTYTYFNGNWGPSIPQVGVGESFFLNLQAAKDWTRVFSVN